MKKILFTILLFIFFIVTPKAQASVMDFDLKNKELIKGEIFKVDLVLDTEDKEVNAIEGYIKFNDDILELQKAYYGDSIVKIWLKTPRVQNNEIYFSGIIPSGYTGKNAVITMLFEAKEIGVTSIEILDKTRVLLNDGHATVDDLQQKNLLVSINELSNGIEKKDEDISMTDKVEPEEFFIKIIKEKQESEKRKGSEEKFMAVFYANDRDSGIAYYEIKEGERDFKRAESPYVLQNQNLTEQIQVKAVDLEGNYRIEKVGPFVIKEKDVFEKYKISIILLAIALVVLIPTEIHDVKIRKAKSRIK